MQDHYNKYGLSDLVFSVIAICDRDDLIPVNGIIWIEQAFIYVYAHIKHNKTRPYFNVDPHAGSRINHVDSEETKKKRSNSMLGLKNALGNELSAETREKIRIAQIELNKSDAVRENKRQKMKGKFLGRETSKETREKQSKAHKNISEETRRKMSDSKKGSVPWNKGKTGIYSEETIRQISEGHKGKPSWNKGKKTGRVPSSAFKKGMIPWNKGLTKDANESLMAVGESMRGNKNGEKRKTQNKAEEFDREELLKELES
jgi:hypothetical protein